MRAIAALACAGWAAASPLAAEEHARAVERTIKPAETAQAPQGRGLVVLPIPQSSPTLGSGLTLVSALYYRPGSSPRPWTTGVGALATDNGSRAIGAFQSADLMSGRLRLRAFAGYGDFRLDFYGAGGAGLSIPIEQTGVAVQVGALYRVQPRLYVGPRWRYAEVETRLDTSALSTVSVDLPDPGVSRTLSGLGLAAEYDTRDQPNAPRRGLYVEGQWTVQDAAFGSDFDYGRFEAATNAYRPAGERAVLALRGSVCRTGDGAPFYDSCSFGSSNDLRGYPGGRYRDDAMATIQAEYRRNLGGRFGAVAFAGVGAVAPAFDELTDAQALPGAGIGLRWTASRAYGVNLSVDYAWGKDESGLYVYVGEAF